MAPVCLYSFIVSLAAGEQEVAVVGRRQDVVIGVLSNHKLFLVSCLGTLEDSIVYFET